MDNFITDNDPIRESFVTLLADDPIRITSQDLREFMVEFPDGSSQYIYQGLDEHKRPAWYFQTADNQEIANAIGAIIEKHFN